MTTRALVLACALAGCGGARSHVNPFPRPAELDRLAALQAPARPLENHSVDPDEWPLTGPLPDAIQVTPYVDASPWGGVLAAEVARRPGLLIASEDMRCIAREVGLFELAKGSAPAPSLLHFIESRCGSAAGHVDFRELGGDASDDHAEPELFAHWRADVVKLTGAIPAKHGLAGLWFGRQHGKAMVVVASGQREAELERIAMVPDADGTVRIAGQLLSPADRMEALINQGRYGFAPCVRDLRVKLPRFVYRCPVAKDDPSAAIDVAAYPPGRVLGPMVLEALAWPAGTLGQTYRRSGEPAVAEAVTAAGLLAALNAVRKDASLAALTLAAAQSADADRLAPHYFGALTGREDELIADKIVLGLEAGWHVPGIVHDAFFAHTAVYDRVSPAELLRAALERPSGRETLLAHDIQTLAIGLISDAGAAGAVFTSYSLFDPGSHAADVDRIWSSIADTRAKLGLPKVLGLPKLQALADKAALRVERGEASPDDALGDLLDDGTRMLDHPMRGWRVEASDLDALPWPDGLQTEKYLGVVFGVAHARERGDAWGRYVILVAYVDAEPPKGTLASRR